MYSSKEFSVFPDRVEQGNYIGKAHSATSMTSDYRSPDADKYSPHIAFKFSINLRDNEMPAGKDHMVTLVPKNGSVTTTVIFGKQLIEKTQTHEGINLEPNTRWTVRADLRQVFKDFETIGYYTLANGDQLTRDDFKGIYIAGAQAPLMWDFNNLHTREGLKLEDPDGDHIYETTLVMNAKENEKVTDASWNKSLNTDAYPQYKSDYVISDAIYNLSLEEMLKAIEPDSTFRTGKEWSGVWTRDISYSIIHSMAYMQPRVAKYSLMRKVSKDKRIIQDTGTGGAWPVSTDRMIWATAAWEIYKATGDVDWLQQAYEIVKNSIEDDLQNAYDPVTGMVKGESSFLDWREQTYPLWMQPADIFESECLGTNAVHYMANVSLSEMASILGHKDVAEKHQKLAEQIQSGINTYLFMPEKGYYAQYLYGRNYKILSPRSEALGEALCVISGIAGDKAETVVNSTPVNPFGIPCIHPQIPGIPPYHNNAVWPFVQSYWLQAAAKTGNEESVMQSIAAIYRPAALFLTNKENFVAETGDFGGTQINSSIMLWSLSGNIGLVHKVLFGIRFNPDNLEIKPFVPEAMKGKRSLTGFRYRKAILDIEMNGFGNGIASVTIDGKQQQLVNGSIVIPETFEGKHTIRIELNSIHKPAETNLIPVTFSPHTPLLKDNEGRIDWEPVKEAGQYIIMLNGQELLRTSNDMIQLENIPMLQECQVIAVDKNGNESFASEPYYNLPVAGTFIVEAEANTQGANLPYKSFSGNGFVEISKEKNITLPFRISVKEEGTYCIDFRYSNGNGPVNTENKCAIRTLYVDKNRINTIVLPQRGKEEWSNWGYTNPLEVKLTPGDHTITLTFEPSNENMNKAVNQAMVDYMRVIRRL